MSAPTWGQMWTGTGEAFAALACGETPIVIRPVWDAAEDAATVALLGRSEYDLLVEAHGFDPLEFRDLAARWAS